LDPIQRSQKGEPSIKVISWETAVSTLADLLKNTPPGELVFLLGLAPDHIYDLAKEITESLGAPQPYRFGALGMFDGQATLFTAVKKVFNLETMPYFDFGKSDLVISFGANFLETWLTPIAFGRAYKELRQGTPDHRGYFVSLEPRQSLTSASADEWIALTPGSENLVAQALGKLFTELKGGESSPYFQDVNIQEAADLSGVPVETLEHMAGLIAQAANPIFLPGGSAITHQNGLETAQAVLALNALVGNLGKPGGVHFTQVNFTSGQ
jgi:anaerobic selenocysteine-containing dehydrogenase